MSAAVRMALSAALVLAEEALDIVSKPGGESIMREDVADLGDSGCLRCDELDKLFQGDPERGALNLERIERTHVRIDECLGLLGKVFDRSRDFCRIVIVHVPEPTGGGAV